MAYEGGGASFSPESIFQGGGAGGGAGGMGGGAWFIPWLFLLFFGFGKDGFGKGGDALGGGGGGGTPLAVSDLQNQINGVSSQIGNLALDNRFDKIDAEIAANTAQMTSQHLLLTGQADRNAAATNANVVAQSTGIKDMLSSQHAVLSAQLANCCCDLKIGQQQIINDVDKQGAETRNMIERTACNTDQLIINSFCNLSKDNTANNQRILDKLDSHHHYGIENELRQAQAQLQEQRSMNNMRVVINENGNGNGGGA